MKIVHVTGSISRSSGGVFDSLRGLALEQLSQGCNVSVLGANDRFTEADMHEWSPLRPKTYGVFGSQSFGFSTGITRALDEIHPELIHLHGIWQYSSYAVSRWVKCGLCRYVVSPHGMLDDWALGNGNLKKKIAGVLYQSQCLQSAACVHALTSKEVDDIRNYGVIAPVCVIPNGVALPSARSKSNACDSEHNTLLYIGRLHPKKGLEQLLEGWGLAKKEFPESQKWNLVIAGWDDGGHEKVLHDIVGKMNLSGSVTLSGPVYGRDKDALFRAADAFVLPSLSEGLPMSVLEAWSYSLPVLMTKECNLPVGFSNGSAVEIMPDPESIRSGLGTLFAMSESDMEKMGAQGRKIVEQDYSWRTQAEKMLSVYSWLLHGGVPPAFVEFPEQQERLDG